MHTAKQKNNKKKQFFKIFFTGCKKAFITVINENKLAAK